MNKDGSSTAVQSPILQLSDVKLTYHTTEAETTAINGLSFDIANGEFVAIVGPSGCGKSSVLSLIAGLITPSAGKIVLLCTDVDCPRSEVGYMLQRDHLFDWRTIWQNVLLGLEIRGSNTDENIERVRMLLKTYGLYEFRNHYPYQLSGGMRQKVSLIRTLAIDPKILLLDEPFSALDYQTRLALSDEISSIIRSEEKTAVLVTHDIAEAISMADRVLVFSARPATIKREFKIELESQLPIARRNSPNFKLYFDAIWKDLDVHVN